MKVVTRYSQANYTDSDENIIKNEKYVLKDLHTLHHCVPALRRTGIDISGIHMHFYPEGGWGWIVCIACFIAIFLSNGMQLAFGQLHVYVAKHLKKSHVMDIVWIGSLSAATSRAFAPLVLGTCFRSSTRLTAVIGGLLLTLASLFTSFAVQTHQVLISYGLVLGAGTGLVRETADLMLGHYFKKRRPFVEMIVQAGTGVGITVFSVLYKQAIGKLGWRLGLQTTTGVLLLAFFLGFIYRSASLYHPQRHAIIHLKNQQNKLKSRSKSPQKTFHRPLIDFSPLSYRPVRMLMLAAGIASFGLYSPAFYITLDKHKDINDHNLSILLQTCLGLSAAMGCAVSGVITIRLPNQCLVSRQYLCQGAFIGVAIAQIVLSCVDGYRGLVMASGLYGASLGASLYSLKMLAFERFRSRQFAKSWALVQAAEALSILFGVPLTGYMNTSSTRLGYYACSFSSLCASALIFFVGRIQRKTCSSSFITTPKSKSLGSLPCACMTPITCSITHPPKFQSLHIPLNKNEKQCSSLLMPIKQASRTFYTTNFLRKSFCADMPVQHSENCGNCRLSHGSLKSSKSVPDDLTYKCHYQFYNQHYGQCNILKLTKTRKYCHGGTVIDRITTSV